MYTLIYIELLVQRGRRWSSAASPKYAEIPKYAPKKYAEIAKHAGGPAHHSGPKLAALAASGYIYVHLMINSSA